MSRVVPSQVVSFIDLVFPWAKDQREGAGVNLTRDNASELAGLLDLANKLPDELLTIGGTDYSSFVCSLAAIREKLTLWYDRDERGNELVFVRRLPQFSPVRIIRDALSKCPDEGAAPATAELLFIADVELQTNLRNDMGAINRALSDSEWKAATVLAGSAIEALLLYDLQNRHAAEIPAATAALVANKTLKRQPNANIERWDLEDYIEVAASIGLIKPETAIQARLAKDFRNLIHPGRAQRLGQNCDRATALSAVAGVEHVVNDLS